MADLFDVEANASFDQALQDIAGKYNVSVDAVQGVIDNDPVLSQFDPDNPQDWQIDFSKAQVTDDTPGQLSDSLLEAIRKGWENVGTSEPEDFFSWKNIGSNLLRVIDTPRAIVTSTVKELGDIFVEGQDFSLGEFADQAFGNERIGFGDVIEEWAPGLGEIEMFGVKPLDNIAGFVGDVVLDPFTWLTLGSLPLAKQGTMGVVRLAARNGDIALARGIFQNGIRAASADDLARLTQVGRRTGQLGADDVLSGGLHFRIPGSKTISRVTGGPTKPHTLQVLSHDNKLLRFTPRFAVNTVAQRFRRSRLGGLLGGEMTLAKKNLMDASVSDEVWLGSFYAIEGNNIGKGVARAFQNAMEKRWSVLSRQLMDENITGKQAYDALGSDVPPPGFPPALHQELKDFAEQLRQEANIAVHINKMDADNLEIEEWIRFREDWQPAVATPEWQEWLRKSRRNLKEDDAWLASFEKRANIRDGEEFLGTRLVKASEHKDGLTPRQQAAEIMEDILAERGEDFLKWFDDDLYSAMDQHIGIVSRRIQGKFTENYLKEMGIVLSREVRDNKAIIATKSYRYVEKRLAELHNEQALAEAQATAAARLAEDGTPESRAAAARVEQARRAKAERWGVNLEEPEGAQIWRDIGDDLNAAADEARVALNAFNDRADDALVQAESAARSAERVLEKSEQAAKDALDGLDQLVAARRALYAEGENIARAVDNGIEAATPFLKRLEELNQEIRELDDVIVQAKADYLVKLGEVDELLAARAKSAQVVKGGEQTIAEIDDAIRTLEHIYRTPKDEPIEIVRALQDKLLPTLQSLSKIMKLPPKRVPATGTQALDYIKDLQRIKGQIEPVVAAHKGIIRESAELMRTREIFTDAQAWRQELLDEIDEINELLEGAIDPAFADELRLVLDQLGASKNGYLTYGGDQVVWYHGSHRGEIDLGFRPETSDMNTRELDSFLGMHLAQNVEFSYANYAMENSDNLAGFLVRAENPVIFGGDMDHIIRGMRAPETDKSFNLRSRGAGLALLHAKMLESGIRNGHYTLEILQDAGVPYAAEIMEVIERTGRSYLDVAKDFADPAARDIVDNISLEIVEDSLRNRALREFLGSRIAPEMSELEFRHLITSTLLGMEQQGNNAARLYQLNMSLPSSRMKWRGNKINFDNPQVDLDSYFFGEIKEAIVDGVKYDPKKPLIPAEVATSTAIVDNAGGFFDDFVYPVTGNRWTVGREGADQLIRDVTSDFVGELRGEGYDSILYSLRADQGSWAVIPLSTAQLELPPPGTTAREGGMGLTRAQGARGGMPIPDVSAGIASQETLRDTLVELYGGMDAMRQSSLADMPLGQASITIQDSTDGLRALLDMYDPDFIDVGNVPKLADRAAAYENELYEILMEFRRNPSTAGMVKTLSAWRGRGAQLLGAWRKELRRMMDEFEIEDIADIEDYADDFGVDASVISNSAAVVQALETLLSDSFGAMQDVTRAVNALNESAITKIVKNGTEGDLVKTVDDTVAALRDNRMLLMYEKFEEADALGDVVNDMHGTAVEAQQQVAKNRARVRELQRKQVDTEVRLEDEAFELEQKELGLRNQADAAHRRADEIETEHYRKVQNQFNELYEDLVQAEADHASIVQSLRLQGQADQAAADLMRINGDVDLLESRFAKMTLPERTTMIGRVMEGYVPLGATGQIPAEVAEAMHDVNKILGARGSNAFVKLFDAVNDLFKSWAIASPGFHSRNFFGGVFNNALAGVDADSYRRFHALYGPVRRAMAEGASVEDQVRAMYSGKRAQKLAQTAEGQRILVGMEQMIRFGMLNGGQTTELANIARLRGQPGQRRINPFNPNNLVTGALRTPTSHVENYLRGSLALDRFMKGGTIQDAYSDVYKYHFDYDDLSAFERGVMRRAVPFYTWTRKNLPLQIEMMLTNPKIYNRTFSLKRELERDAEAEGAMPKWIAERFNIQLPLTMGGDNLVLVPDLPFTDVDEGFNVRRQLANTSPLIKVPLEMTFDTNLFFGGANRGRQQPVPDAWRVLLAPAIPPLRSVGAINVDDDGRLVATEEHMRYLESFLPVLGTLRRLIPTSDDPKTEERYIQNMVNWTFGLGIRRITEREREFELWRRENPAFFE